jgi:hypothetical protein
MVEVSHAGWNSYSYSTNPLASIDPTGLDDDPSCNCTITVEMPGNLQDQGGVYDFAGTADANAIENAGLIGAIGDFVNGGGFSDNGGGDLPSDGGIGDLGLSGSSGSGGASGSLSFDSYTVSPNDLSAGAGSLSVGGQAGQVISDTAVGGIKGGLNLFIGLANTVNGPVDALLSNFTSFQFGQMSEYNASTPGEKSAMAGVFIASFFTGVGEEAAAGKIESITADAEQLYPRLAGKYHDHHIIPKYLGGAKDGQTANINAAYHQLITNEFRRLAPYGQKVKPSAESLVEILREVYTKYPLPLQ